VYLSEAHSARIRPEVLPQGIPRRRTSGDHDALVLFEPLTEEWASQRDELSN
jgi:hypothetical protein